MTRSSYHPQSELLAAYSAGSLPLSQALCIATHIEHCDECRINVQRLNSLGAELLQQLKPASASNQLRDKLLSQLDDLPAEIESIKSSSEADPAIPRCLHPFVEKDFNSLNWHRVSPSIHTSELCRDGNGAKVELIRIKAGASTTRHTHMGDEYTVVLQGSFSDESGLYHKGDFLVKGSSDVHTPVATRDGECICLAVTEAPIQFTGLLSRWLNPFIRRSYQ